MNIKITGLFLASFILLFGALHAQTKKQPTGQTTVRASMARGKIVYANVCLPCHMADGGGVQNMNPPLINTTYILGDKAALIKIVLHGFNEDVEINGKTYSNSMSAHDDLKDQQIADVLTYVRHSFGNKASTVKAAEVAKVRTVSKK
ncbi:mono/diheme cytochrome c family protein [Mucilaginibacter frigoritolerans]|uniref:Mono/diheme cytochrome c family protein n=1 Tax=Mucilaginibacter frigoritolerans TaxID=652788 RepID=A0A562TLZ1_9SPHI|nr:cytochrome c [Mucilaginibacter frigoritolerans]TWI94557.1 mono/diheme cytochrome c family protein [Mucilaginibacter frigoritolerans]